MAALFFSQRKPRGFNYIPRYYDPDAEGREDRKKIVLGDKYRTPAQRERDAAKAAGGDAPDDNYVPGTYLREHISARRGAHASDVMRKRRRKARSIPVLIVILAAIVYFVWMFYFK